LGLADTLGGLETAIAMAVKKAGLKEYRTISLPEQKDPLESIMSDLATEARMKLIATETGDLQPYFMAGQSMLKLKGIQALCPFSIRNY
jgi:protease-4